VVTIDQDQMLILTIIIAIQELEVVMVMATILRTMLPLGVILLAGIHLQEMIVIGVMKIAGVIQIAADKVITLGSLD